MHPGKWHIALEKDPLGDTFIAALFTTARPISNPNPYQQGCLRLSADTINRMLFRREKINKI